MSLKIVGIVGSLRKQSVNRAVMKDYAKLAQDQFELTEADLSGIPMYNQDVQDEQGLPDSVQKVVDEIRRADGVIFFSPEYNYSIPGVLKNALDWVSRADDQPLSQKPAAIIGCSPGNIGTARMQYHLRKVGVFLDIKFLNKPEVMIGKVHDKLTDGRLSDAKTKDFLTQHISVFKDFVESQ